VFDHAQARLVALTLDTLELLQEEGPTDAEVDTIMCVRACVRVRACTCVCVRACVGEWGLRATRHAHQLCRSLRVKPPC
jgi:hypothetical protein